MTFKDWLIKFIDETELDREHVFEFEHEGELHFMDFEIVIDSILAFPEKFQLKIKNELLAIDGYSDVIGHLFRL